MGWSRYNLLKQQGGLVLAILDIVMQSGKSGLWLASKIHEDNPKLPILAITGNKRNVPEGSDLFEAVIEKTGNYARFREAVAYYLPK